MTHGYVRRAQNVEGIMTFTIEQLAGALSEGAAGVRLKVELEPLGGKYDKVFPPTYGVEDSAGTRYAVEVRRGENGDETTAVALDSVSSQANPGSLGDAPAPPRDDAP